MKVHYHTGISLVLAVALYAVFRSISLSVTTLITGIFVDIDHGFDYLREYGFKFNIKFFFKSFHDTLFRRIVLLFHGWEWIALLGIFSVASSFDPVICGILLGLGSHLICDQFTNGVTGWGYFFFFRLKKKFVVSAIFPGKGLL